ncbi:Enoyl-(acyl-carrier-protein) reductase (NADH) 1 [Candidatus Xenohaliotis californiensis]|uniref:Enoyl-[acyl-carrier-protein] reductase [NADH] n=1 Tax=Candidatus Xenohaliotis californiensis TaxID=84677 RepID=A0ABM9N8Q3_9RICK|nr:Enoyl-(acyl-carrier-protein) reductase (NADH) 1 [Candidatus Xenohaliotis californiensis]
MSNKLLQNKKGLICGITNSKSIGWGIAKVLAEHGAEIIFTYQNESILKRIKPLANEIGTKLLLECDITNEQAIDKTFQQIEKHCGNIDFCIHSIAFADKKELKGMYINTSKDNFKNAMEISCYSFTALAQRSAKLMTNGGSMLTMSYYGAKKFVPNYNVMGLCKAALEASVRYLAMDLGRFNIRVNAISAGPVKTMAASGIEHFAHILNWNSTHSPLMRSVTLEDIGKSALFLVSSLSSGITGEVLMVDAGYHIIGVPCNNK